MLPKRLWCRNVFTAGERRFGNILLPKRLPPSCCRNVLCRNVLFPIEDEVPEDDLESEIEETSEFHSELSSFIQKCQSLIEKQENASDANEVVTTTAHVRNAGSGAGSIKLPKRELPNFSGKYTEWTSFYDLFNASVHSNSSLRPAKN